MKYDELYKKIKRGEIAGIYLFYGEEEYIKESAINKIIKSMIAPDFIEFNYQLIDGTEVSVETIINACETLPFMAEKRLVVVKDFYMINGKKKDDEQEKKLVQYLKKAPDTTCLVFYNYGDIDKRKAIYKCVKNIGSPVEFSRLDDYELQRWIIKKVNKLGEKMDMSVANDLIMMVGNDLTALNNEIKKLVSYAGDDAIIDKNSIQQVVTGTLEYTIFQLVDAIGERKSGEALIMSKQLLDEGQPVLVILSMIVRQFRLLFLCKGYHEKGYSVNTITQKLNFGKLNVKSFVVKKCLKQGRNFTIKQLRQGLRYCLDIDYGIKDGSINDIVGMEMLIVKLCNI